MSKNVPVGKTSHAVINFEDASDGPGFAPAGVVPVWRKMDDSFNADADKGFVTVTPAADGLSADITGVALGKQNLQVDVAALASYRVTIDTSAPATHFVVTFGTPA